MELRHLRYFVTVAEELSFRRAARRLHVSHPALSQQIQDLEDELGLKLMERNSRRVELTEVGRAFLSGARRTLQAAKQAVTLAQEAARGERGSLVIGCIGALVSSFLPDALARFREQRPLVEATVLHMNNRAQIEALLDGSITLGIGYFGSLIDEDEQEQLSIQLLLRSPVAIAFSKHRRYPRRTPPKLKDFRHDTFLSFDLEYGGGYEEWLRGFCRRVGGFEPEIGARVNSPESAVSMIAAGRGVLLGAEIGIRSRAGAAAIDFYRLEERETQFEICTIWKKQSEGTPVIHKFIEVLRESIKVAEIV
jgi:DNA-binding transcriptional LysR family regulator